MIWSLGKRVELVCGAEHSPRGVSRHSNHGRPTQSRSVSLKRLSLLTDQDSGVARTGRGFSWTRLARVTLALLHICVLGAAQVADARLSDPRGARSHIEAEGTVCSLRLHSDHCLLCQLLQSPQDYPDHKADLPLAELCSSQVALERRNRVASRSLAGSTFPRAPPQFLQGSGAV